MTNIPLKRCARCGAEKPADLEHFNRSSARKDGLYSYCKPCDQEDQRLKRYARQGIEPPARIPEGMKRCITCERTLPLDEFYARTRRAAKDAAYHSECKACIAERGRRKHRERLAQQGRKPQRRLPARAGHKVCTRCRRELPASEEHFGRHTGSFDGWYPRCRACVSLEQREKRKQAPVRPVRRGRWQTIINAASHANRKARKLGAEGRVTSKEWLAKIEEYASCCYWCKKKVSGTPTLDHRIPLAPQPGQPRGTNWIDNIVPACHNCNSRKRNMPEAKFRKRQEALAEAQRLLEAAD